MGSGEAIIKRWTCPPTSSGANPILLEEIPIKRGFRLRTNAQELAWVGSGHCVEIVLLEAKREASTTVVSQLKTKMAKLLKNSRSGNSILLDCGSESKRKYWRDILVEACTSLGGPLGSPKRSQRQDSDGKLERIRSAVEAEIVATETSYHDLLCYATCFSRRVHWK